jgi:Clp amino terminal domain, pathogenicity island component
MIELDVADLVVIAGAALGIGAERALSQFDITAAEAALSEARTAGREPRGAGPGTGTGAGPAAGIRRTATAPGDPAPLREAAGVTAAALMRALLRHPPLPGHGEQLAVAAGLQFLAVNGWQADLDVPAAAVVVVERLASGELTAADAGSWLAPRLSPHPATHRTGPARRVPMAALLPPGSRSRRVALGPLAAVRHHQRRKSRGPGPFVITLGSADSPAGIRTPATGLLPFTGPARDTLIRSGEEPGRHGPPRDLEHILLALIAAGDGVAVRALERLGISQEAVRDRITGEARPGAARPGRLPNNPQVRRLWQAVLDEAVAHGDDYIGTEHFLLGLFCDHDAAVVQALAGLGAGESQVRAAVTAQLAESGPERPPIT